MSALNERDRNLLERGATALRAGDYSAAERFCSEVLERIPGDPDALNILGAVAFSKRSFREAERLFSLSATASPENLGALFNLGKVYEVQQRLEDAAGAYRNILRVRPKDVQTRLRFGIVRYQQGEMDDAIEAFASVLTDEPENDSATLSLGVAYNAAGRYEESVRVLRGLIARRPDQSEAYHALADSLYELHRVEEAANAARAALGLDRNDIQATILLGQVECDRGNFTQAESMFNAAASKEPERFEPPMNLGVLFQRTGRLADAIEYGKRAVDLAPSEPLAHLNYAMGLLLAGDFARGWREFEWRILDPKMRAHFPYRDSVPLWTGERLGGTLLISREQGLGDFILFSRFFGEVASRAARTLVEVPPELCALYRHHGFPGIEICEDRCEDAARGEVNAQVSLCSLPFVLGIVSEERIPRRIPYLQAEAAKTARFRERVASAGNGLRVGVVWAGSPGHLLDRYRSAPVRAYETLADLPGVTWFSLQKGAHEPMRALPVIDLAAELHDFSDTAAAVEALDLIVSVDTAVAHLAGALGKPVWLLSGFGSYWLWQLERSDSPWYPTMRLFRQPKASDWTGLFTELRQALAQRIQA